MTCNPSPIIHNTLSCGLAVSCYVVDYRKYDPYTRYNIRVCDVLLMNWCHPYYSGELLTATLPGWTQCYCPIPRAKPGLLDGHPCRLVKFIGIIVSWQYGAIGKWSLKLGRFYYHYRHLEILGLHWVYWKIRKMYWVITDTGGVTIK